MKKLMLTTAVCFIGAIAIQAQVSSIVKGKVAKGHPAKKAWIGYEDKNSYKTDTVEIKEGRFEFKVSSERPALAQVTLVVPPPPGERRRRNQDENEDATTMKNMALFYTDGTVQLAFDTAGIATITGGGKEEAAHKAFTAMGKANAEKGDAGLPFEKMVTGFIQQYPDAYMSLDIMEMFAGVIQPATFEPMYTALSPRLQNTAKAKAWKQRLDEAKKLDVGQKSIDFTLNDVKGTPVSLSAFRGKYVLLDFWASWCGPCRAGHPELISIYNKFRGDKFEIFAVSLDTKKDAWLKAIEEDKLPWRLVIDAKDASADVAKKYNVTQIPQNLLIGPDGVIVARNLTGKNLENKLAELMKP